MKTRILIDAIVRQTTVLIARLSTAEGVRSPLGHVAQEVFTGLVDELSNQGVSNKVIADMFGLALRSYRQKVQRMGESESSRGVTLWTAVQEFLAEREWTSRAELEERFRFDEEASLRGILNDLVEGGFVVRAGRAESTRYRPATEEELRDFGAAPERNNPESLANLVWLQVYRQGPLTRERLAQLVPVEASVLQGALASVLSQGRVKQCGEGAEAVLTAEELLVPLGEAAGWEAAVVDHYQAVCNALAAKLCAGQRSSAQKDEVGGTTLTFDLWPGHPREAEVRRLLSECRERLLPLWEEVSEYNKSQLPPEPYQLHFYFGQYLVLPEAPPSTP